MRIPSMRYSMRSRRLVASSRIAAREGRSLRSAGPTTRAWYRHRLAGRERSLTATLVAPAVPTLAGPKLRAPAQGHEELCNLDDQGSDRPGDGTAHPGVPDVGVEEQEGRGNQAHVDERADEGRERHRLESLLWQYHCHHVARAIEPT